MRYFLIIVITMAFCSLSFAQQADKKAPQYGWKKELVGNLNFTQNTFDNWKQGGENAWAWQLTINGKWVNDQKNYDWENTLKINYGKTKVGDAASKKSTDELNVSSVYTYKMGIYVNPFVSFSGLTQFTKGYKYEADTSYAISEFLDPGYFMQTLGIGYAPNNHIKTRLGAAFKETMADKYANLYSKGKKFRVEYGANSVTELNFKLAQNILYTGKLQLFSNLKAFNQIDVNWDNMLASKISKYISVNFNVKLFYDRDVSPKRQLQEVLAVGLTYNFF